MKKEFIKEISESHYPVEMWETSKGCFDDMNEGDRNTFKEGFNAAIELELPVKFTEWWTDQCFSTSYFGSVRLWLIDGTHMDLGEMYQHWANNIYKP